MRSNRSKTDETRASSWPFLASEGGIDFPRSVFLETWLRKIWQLLSNAVAQVVIKTGNSTLDGIDRWEWPMRVAIHFLKSRTK